MAGGGKALVVDGDAGAHESLAAALQDEGTGW